MDEKQSKPVVWIGSSHERWRAFPDDVQDVLGYALHLAQCGEKANNPKPLTGFKGASVLEITDDYDSDTYRALSMFFMFFKRKARRVLPHRKVTFS